MDIFQYFSETFGFFDDTTPEFVKRYLGEPDFRVKKWFLLNSPKWFIITLIFYISFITIARKILKYREPFKCRKLLVKFNIFQVLFSAYIFKEVLICAFKMRYNIVCQPLIPDKDTNSLRMAEAFWYFYLSKYIDLFDTVFLVLKKKKISFLHMYHHSTMLFNWYLGVLYLPGGQTFSSVLVNCAVHVIMYTYYFLSALGPQLHKYLWWKKYLTQMQLLQFAWIIFHVSLGLATNCNLPKWLAWFTIIYLFTLIALFLNFYTQTYKTKQIGRKQKNIFTLPSRKNSKLDFQAGGDKKTF